MTGRRLISDASPRQSRVGEVKAGRRETHARAGWAGSVPSPGTT